MVAILDRHTTELVRRSVRGFLAQFARRGADFSRYLCIDLATTGLNSQEDLIVDFGWCEVRGDETATGHVLLDWTQPPYHAEPLELASSFESIRYAMEQRGQSYDYSLERMQQQGTPALQALREIRQRLVDAMVFGWPIVSHQSLAFDCEFLEYHLGELDRNPDAVPPDFTDCRVFDTGVIHKAAVLDEYPLFHETMADFTLRISSLRTSHPWNLSSLVELYQLNTQDYVGARDDMGYQAWLTHRLFERMRSLAAEPAHAP